MLLFGISVIRQKIVSLQKLTMFIRLAGIIPLLSIIIGYSNEQKLQENLKLNDYTTIELTFLEISEETDKFYANITFKFQYTLNESPPDNIYLQASRAKLNINKVTFNGYILPKNEYGFDNSTDNFKVRFVNETETFYIKIEYEGVISTEDNFGIYKRIFIGDNTTNVLLATNLAHPYSGRLFPSFEPLNQKTKYRFHITIPDKFTVTFNTALEGNNIIPVKGFKEYIFKTTPVISASALSFVIGNLACSSTKHFENITYEICTKRHIESNFIQFTKDVVNETMHFLNNFTQQSYSNYMSKITEVVFPVTNIQPAAQWGLISTGENNVFWDIWESSNSKQQKIASLFAKAIGKQWFGNLVTPQLATDQMLLVEGLSEYFQYVSLNSIFPSWELEKLFVIETLQASMDTDSYYSQHELVQNTEMSDVRASSLIRMIQDASQLESMQPVVQQYLSKNLLGITKCEDFWKVLDNQIKTTNFPDSTSHIMEQWIQGSSYPLLNVKLNGHLIIVSQESFAGNTDKGKWYIPVTWTTSKDANKFDSAKPHSTWLKPDSDFQLTLDADWIILNNKGTGYYRVNYDSILWYNIKTALQKSDFDGILEINRAQIVDDLFNFAKYGKIAYYESGSILSFLQFEKSYYPWHSALRGYSFLLERAGENSTLGKAMSETLVKSLETVYNSIKIPILYEDEKTHIDALKVEKVVKWACKMGNQNCIGHIRKMFSAHIQYNITINKNVRKPIYCNGLRYSNDSEEWMYMWNKYINFSNDIFVKEYVFPALGCTKNLSLLNRYLFSVVNDDKLFTPEDVLTAFFSVIEESPEGIQVARIFFLENFKLIGERIPFKDYLKNIIVKIASKVTTKDELEMFLNFVNTTELTADQKSAFTEAIKIAEFNLNWLETYRKDLESFYIYGNPLNVSSPFYANLLFCIYLFINFCVFNRDLILSLFVRGYDERLDQVSIYSL